MGSDATFDSAPFNSGEGFDIVFEPGNTVFGAGFGGLAVDLGAKGTAPIVTRAFSFAVKLSSADPGSEIPLRVQGFAKTGSGVGAHLLLSVNDQTMVVDFPENSDNSFLKILNYKVGAESDLRITTFLVVDRDSTSDEGASLTVSTIDIFRPVE